jgi:hypothetical protein
LGVDGSVIGYDSSIERRWYASAFGSEPQWAEAAETAHELEKVGMLEKADAVEMLEKADAEME